jgi:O-antigen ligase
LGEPGGDVRLRATPKADQGGALDRALTHTGVAGLFIFAFCARAATSAAYLGLLLMLLAFVIALPRIWPALRREPAVWLGLAFTAYLAARTAWAVNEFPATAGEQVNDAMKLFQLWLFPVLAWWLGGDRRRIAIAVVLGLAGFLVGAVHRTGLEDIAAVAAGGRSGFGMPAIALGLYTATGLLGLFVLAPRFVGQHDSRWHVPRLIAWLALVALMVGGLLASQSRGSWIAALLVVPPAVVLRYRASWRRPARGGRIVLAAAVVAIAVTAALVYGYRDVIKHRMLWEDDTLRAVITLDEANIPYSAKSSLGVRFHLTRLGLERFAERPVFGWGPGSSQMLIERDPRPALHQWVDLHNSYLEILVRLGAIGAALFAAGALLTVRALRKAGEAGAVDRGWFWFLAGVLALTAIWSVTDFRMIHTDWRFYWWLFGGIVYTFRLHAVYR